MNKIIKWNNETFYLEKQKSRWAFVENKTRLPVAFGRIKKEAMTAGIDGLEKAGIKKLKQAIERALNKKILTSEKIAWEFKAYFKTDIKIFINSFFTFFDIIRFDSWLRVPDGISCKKYIAKQYGKKASRFIEYINQL